MAAIMALLGMAGAVRGGGQGMLLALTLADVPGKIERYVLGLPLEAAEVHPATAHVVMINPLSGAGFAGMFRTHPPTAERSRRLLTMAA